MPRISDPYGPRIDPVTGKPSFHHGVDYAVPVGTPIYANQPMTVTRVGYEPGYGNYVYAKDANGTEYRYGHLDSANVKVGDTVNPGDKIANTGNTGKSTGAHLHYEVRTPDGKSVDPQKTDPNTGKPYQAAAGFEKGKDLNGSNATKEPNYKPETGQPKPPIPQPVPAPPVPGQPPGQPPPPDQGSIIGQTTPAINKFFGGFGYVMNPRLGAGDLRDTRVPR